MDPIYLSNDEPTDEWVSYIENEAAKLSQSTEFEIQNYLDSEILNPEIRALLSSETQEEPSLMSYADMNLSLNLAETNNLAAAPDWLWPRFVGLKAKVKRIFCSVLQTVGNLDSKGIIKAVLLAIVPAFSAGLLAALMPIVIGLVALFLKYGIDKVCPM